MKPHPTEAGHLVESEPSAEDLLRLDELLYAYNVECTGQSDGRRLAIFLRRDDGELIGGLAGWTWAGTCCIDLIYLPIERRRQGEGSRLMIAAESEARSRSCERMVVRTHDFQAPGFYEKLGFSQVGAVEYPAGQLNITYMKLLKEALADGAVDFDGVDPARASGGRDRD